MELFFEVWIFEHDLGISECVEFSNVGDAYLYASSLKELGFKPYVVRDYRVKV